MERNPDLSDIEVVQLEKVETTAVQSQVIKISNLDDSLNDESFNLGHIHMFDFEDVELERVIDFVKNRLGYGFVFQSNQSESDYHVYNTSIKSLIGIKEFKDSVDIDDQSHSDIGLEKGCFALRITNKGYKPKPSYIGFFKRSDYNVKIDTHSYPHLKILEDHWGISKARTMIEECKVVGDLTRVVVYDTYVNNHDADDLMTGKQVIEAKKRRKRELKGLE